jgi:hypothetical protein
VPKNNGGPDACRHDAGGLVFLTFGSRVSKARQGAFIEMRSQERVNNMGVLFHLYHT